MSLFLNHTQPARLPESRSGRAVVLCGLLAVLLHLPAVSAAEATPTRRPVVAPQPAAVEPVRPVRADADGPSRSIPAEDGPSSFDPLLLKKKTGKATRPDEQQPADSATIPPKPADGRSAGEPKPGFSGSKADRPSERPAGSRTDTDEELLRELRTGGAKGADSGADPLNSILERVKEIEERIGRRETGEKTQLAQKALIDELEQLLKQPPQNQPRQPQGSSGRQSSPDQRQKQQRKEQQKQAAGQKESAAESEQDAEGGATQTKEGQAEDSEETIREQQRQKAELARR
ncbi:MAG: hypothetical protein KDA79_19520, partial [Planctomycetaceae bacterium]|nr:hypothetical protein [Planctomycetaceae bacterium]